MNPSVELSSPDLPSSVPLLLTARVAAGYVGVSERTWRAWDTSGRTPEPICLGRSKFWSPFELADWVRQRCPPRTSCRDMP